MIVWSTKVGRRSGEGGCHRGISVSAEEGGTGDGAAEEDRATIECHGSEIVGGIEVGVREKCRDGFSGEVDFAFVVESKLALACVKNSQNIKVYPSGTWNLYF